MDYKETLVGLLLSVLLVVALIAVLRAICGSGWLEPLDPGYTPLHIIYDAPDLPFTGKATIGLDSSNLIDGATVDAIASEVLKTLAVHGLKFQSPRLDLETGPLRLPRFRPPPVLIPPRVRDNEMRVGFSYPIVEINGLSAADADRVVKVSPQNHKMQMLKKLLNAQKEKGYYMYNLQELSQMQVESMRFMTRQFSPIDSLQRYQ